MHSGIVSICLRPVVTVFGNMSRRKANVWPFFKYIYRMNHQVMDSVEFFNRGDGNCLAYRRTRVALVEDKDSPDLGPGRPSSSRPRPRLSRTTTGSSSAAVGDTAVHNHCTANDTDKAMPKGIMFLPGFLSNMNGGKALVLEQFCKKSRYEFIRFDYQGCGESKGDIDMNTYPFDVWKEDALAVLDNLTTGPQVLVGSSMGGAIMLLLALERPERIHSLVGIAAPNYGNTSLLSRKVEDNTENKNSSFSIESFIGQRNMDLMSKKTLEIRCPLRLIHGMQDDVVKYESALELANKVESEDVRVILQKSGTHRMSTPEGLYLLIKTVEDVLNVNSRL